jgi:RNA polymerase sigma-70 factor (ECF subfamily)
MDAAVPIQPDETLTHLMAPDGAPDASFDALIWPLVEPAFRLALAMLGDWHEAEDAVQEATVKAWRGAGGLRAPVALRSWYLAIVANQCRSVRRGRWFSLVRVADPSPPPEPGVDVEGLAMTSDLRRALRRLSPEDRSILLLVYGMDLSLAEAAASLGIGLAAAKSRAHRAVARLRPHVDRYGEEVP